MSDIHIGRSPHNKAKGLIKIQLYFHVPTGKDATNKYPGITPTLDEAGTPIPVSAAPGILEDELTELTNGTLCEVFRDRFFSLGDSSAETKADIKTEIRKMWQAIADEKLEKFNREYPFYGTLLSKV